MSQATQRSINLQLRYSTCICKLRSRYSAQMERESTRAAVEAQSFDRESTSRLLLSSAGGFSDLRFDNFFPASSQAIVIAISIIENTLNLKFHPKSPCPGHCTLFPAWRNPFAFGHGERGNIGQRTLGCALKHPRCPRSRDREGIRPCVREQLASANLPWPETHFYRL